jgi:hypothetical protein
LLPQNREIEALTNKTMEAITDHVIPLRRRQSGGLSRPRLIPEWQSGPETISGRAQRKLRLVFARLPLDGDAVVQDFLKCPAPNAGDKGVTDHHESEAHQYF